MKRNRIFTASYAEETGYYNNVGAGIGNAEWYGSKSANAGSLQSERQKEKAAAMCLLITVVSFIGFWVENIFMAFTSGCMDNRNMVFPFLLGYGLAIMAIYFMFGTPNKPRFFSIDLSGNNKFMNTAIFFMIAFLCVSVGECLLGTFVEEACGIIWWDYSDIPMHITKYTSVPTSAGFAFLITVFMGCFCEVLLKAFSKMNKKVLFTLAVIFMALLVSDFIFSGLRMFETGELMKIWHISLR